MLSRTLYFLMFLSVFYRHISWSNTLGDKTTLRLQILLGGGGREVMRGKMRKKRECVEKFDQQISVPTFLQQTASHHDWENAKILHLLHSSIPVPKILSFSKLILRFSSCPPYKPMSLIIKISTYVLVSPKKKMQITSMETIFFLFVSNNAKRYNLIAS